MLPLPIYLIFDLMGFMVNMPLAVIFYIIYWKLGKRLTDLLFANTVICNAFGCLAISLIDSVIPVGTNAYAVPRANETTLFWVRFLYVVGLIAMPIMLHFILRYCRVPKITSRHIFLLYVFFMLGVPVVLSDWFVQIRTVPLADRASWRCLVPWAPHYSTLVVTFSVAWLLVLTFSQWVLYHYRNQPIDNVAGSLRYTGLIRVAFLIQCLAVLSESIAVSQEYAGMSLVVLTTPIMCILIAIAIVKEQIRNKNIQRNLDQELSIARTIQDNLPPAIPPVVPGFDLAGWTRAATYVGGDTYDFLRLADDRFLITIGDATGHGMGPALIISETRALSRAAAYHCDRPSEILSSVDELLSQDIFSGMFVTFFVGLLDPDRAVMTCASAGQGPVLFYQQTTGKFEEQPISAPPLGLNAITPSLDKKIDDIMIKFETGDILALISDGIFEARNTGRKEFGVTGVTDCLLRYRDESARKMVDCLRQEVENFTGKQQDEDDMTIVVIKKN